MVKQTEKIMKFSKIIHILLKITVIVLIVILCLEVFAWLFLGMDLPKEIVNINGVDMEAPVLFKIGSTRVIAPFIWESGFDPSSISGIHGFLATLGFGDILATVFTLIGVIFARRVFKLLRENGSPFREDVVKTLKKLAIVLLVVGCVSGAIPFLAAGITWVLCLIFDYGRMLQDESDTTL